MQLCIPGTSLKCTGFAFTTYLALGSQASASKIQVVSPNGIHIDCGNRHTSMNQAPFHFCSPDCFSETRLESLLTFCLFSFWKAQKSNLSFSRLVKTLTSLLTSFHTVPTKIIQKDRYCSDSKPAIYASNLDFYYLSFTKFSVTKQGTLLVTTFTQGCSCMKGTSKSKCFKAPRIQQVDVRSKDAQLHQPRIFLC